MAELTGSQLKSIREEKHIPLEQVASATRIRLSLLEALENDEYAELGSRTQARGFLKIYADFLGVPLETTPESTAPAPIPASPIMQTAAAEPGTSARSKPSRPKFPG